MRRCEKCKGPGPCLWEDAHSLNSGLYLCKACHSQPEDLFFRDQTRDLASLEALVQIVSRDALHPDCHKQTILDLLKELVAAHPVIAAAQKVNKNATVTPMVYGSTIAAQSSDLWLLRDALITHAEAAK